MLHGKNRLANYYSALFILALLTVIAGYGRQTEEKRSIPNEVFQQQFGVAPLLADTATSLMESHPPIDDNNSPYLFPHEHPDLPKNIADWLSERGYVIPQDIPKEDWDKYFPINVISGEFIKRGQTDIAVFCTNRKKTAIIIFLSGKLDELEIIDRTPDSISPSHPEGVPLECCHYWLTPISAENIFKTYLVMRSYDIKQPPPLYHDGFWAVWSTIYYNFEGEWHSMLGGD